VLLVGCGTERLYPGPERPAASVARIDGTPSFNGNIPIAAVIRKVDDAVIGVRYAHVSVEPGPHTVLVDCTVSETHTTTRFDVPVDAVAGRRYVMVAESAPGNTHCAAVHVEVR
jgi:hypothetical protein